MNVGQAIEKSLKYIAEYSNNSVKIPYSKNADYILRAKDFINAAQNEIAAQFKRIVKTFSIVQMALDSMTGLYGFDSIMHTNTDNVQTVGKGAKAYYFEVNDIATVYIEECVNGNWITLETINNNVKGKFTAYKNLINANNPNNDIRIRFSGNYPYMIKNRALYQYSFPDKNSIPDYVPYVKYQLPTDYMEIKSVTIIKDQRQRVSLAQYMIEGKKYLVLNYFDKGEIVTEYYAYPTQITSSTPDTAELEVDIEAQEAIPLYVGSHMIYDENPQLATILMNEYNLRLSRLIDVSNFTITEIQSVNNW